MSHAQAVHDQSCPEIGPVCEVRDEPPQQHHTSLWLTEVRLLAEYGLTDHFALQGVLPLRILGSRTTFTDLAGNPIELDYANIHHHDEDLVGLGDAQLLLHASAALGAFKVGGRFGVSLPTGRVQPNPFKLGELGLPHEHVQFGTGTLDPVLGVDVARDFQLWSIAAFGASQLPLYAGVHGYQAGIRLGGGLLVSSRFGLPRATFRLGVNWVQELPERWDGAVPTEDGNLGRTDLFAGAGVTVPFLDDWSVSLDVRARVWGHVVGAQFSMPVVVELSLGRLFHFESGQHEERPAVEGDVREIVRAGEEAPLTGVPGKWTVFDFWAPWCEACGVLDHGLRAWVADDPGIALRRVNIVDFESPIALRELRGVEALPHVRLVSPGGEVVLEESGPADTVFARLRETIDRLRGDAGKPRTWTCPMHPEVRLPGSGTCPKCGMPLTSAPTASGDAAD